MKGKFGLGMNRNFETALQRMQGKGEGGARNRIYAHSVMSENTATKQGVPWILAKLYAPSPIINTDQMRNEGEGMISRLYVPAGGVKHE